ncbi:MAG: hypothetical protein HQK66_04460, partial [Desulfamplus sp.]|nr:hypothetical protein [Desulfamplus sp.]
MKLHVKSLSCLFVSLLFSFILAKNVSGGCMHQETIINNNYIGVCGATHATKFTLHENTFISTIRIWYDTSIAGDDMVSMLLGPDLYSIFSHELTKGECQWNFCEAFWHIEKKLPAGDYTLFANTTSICSDPSGRTTLVLYGCTENYTLEPELNGINPPLGIIERDLTGNLSSAPVNMGDVITGGSQMELFVNFPAYNKPVDIWIAILLPDGRFYVADEAGDVWSLDSAGFVPLAENVAGESTVKQIIDPFPIGAAQTPFEPWPENGNWWLYWLIAPRSNGDIIEAIDRGNFELGYYMFNVAEIPSDDPADDPADDPTD